MGASIAIALATVSIIVFGVFGSSGTTTTSTTLAVSTSTSDGTTSTTLDDGTNTSFTLPGGGTGGDSIPAVGTPIPIAELRMSSNDIGPLDFGDDGDEVLGRLVATFGPPSADTGFRTGSGSFGECPGDSVRVVGWGPLRIVVKGEAGSSEFISYRLDLRYGGINSPTSDLATLSGLRVGNKVSELQSIYSQFSIEFVVDQSVGGLVFEVRLTQNSPVLLWGPVESQAPDALVTGIYSPNHCTTATTSTTAGS